MSQRTAHILLAVLLSLAVGRYLLVTLYIHPFADDWSYTVAGMESPLLQRLVQEHRSWNGRWFSNILVLNNPMVLGLEQGLFLYRTVPVMLLGLTFVGAFLLWRELFQRTADRCHGILAASLFLVLYLQLMPDLCEGIYWYTGAISYQLPSALLLMLMASWSRYFREQGRWTRGWSILANGLLTAMIAGCSETHMVLMVLFYGALILWKWRTDGTAPKVLLVFSLFAIALGLFMFLAPGNAVRAANFPERGRLLHTLTYATLHTGRFVLTWLVSPALLAASVVWALFVRRSGIAVDRSIAPGGVLLVTGMVVFLLMALPFWSTGILGQHRTVNVACILFLPGWALFLATVGRYALVERLLAMVAAPVRQRMVWAVFFVALFFTGNGFRAGVDLQEGRLGHYDRGVSARYEAIRTAVASGAAELRLEAIDPMPRSLRILDAGPDPGHWGNSQLVRYFGGSDLRLIVGSESTTGPAQ
jgi:hypothetical protein